MEKNCRWDPYLENKLRHWTLRWNQRARETAGLCSPWMVDELSCSMISLLELRTTIQDLWECAIKLERYTEQVLQLFVTNAYGLKGIACYCLLHCFWIISSSNLLTHLSTVKGECYRISHRTLSLYSEVRLLRVIIKLYLKLFRTTEMKLRTYSCMMYPIR